KYITRPSTTIPPVAGAPQVKLLPGGLVDVQLSAVDIESALVRICSRPCTESAHRSPTKNPISGIRCTYDGATPVAIGTFDWRSALPVAMPKPVPAPTVIQTSCLPGVSGSTFLVTPVSRRTGCCDASGFSLSPGSSAATVPAAATVMMFGLD